MQTNIGEQPGAVEKQKTGDQPTPEPSSQFATLSARVIANIRVPRWPSNVQQYYIEKPNLIPGAFSRGFNTLVVTDLERAREVLEQFLWDFKRNPMANHFHDLNDAMKIIIWITRQSKGLTESVVLHSPFDPDEEDFNCPLAQEAGRLLGVLESGLHGLTLWTLLKGLGSPLMFNGSSSQSNVWHFFFTANDYGRGEKSKRLYWKDAAEGSKEIFPPDIGKIAKG